jgi:CRISPR-associated Csh1 family protein
MLRSITLLGKASKDEPLKSIVDKTNAKHVFIIILNKDCKYVGLTSEDNKGEEKYLYKREKGGLPGKFITGRIGAIDLKNLKRNLKRLSEKKSDKSALAEINKFKEKKIAWVQRPSILRNDKAIAKIPPKSAHLLKSITEEVTRRQESIMKELSKLVLRGDYDEVLLTVKVGQKYLSEIEGFPELLQIAAQGEESAEPSTAAARCVICNQRGSGDKLKEPLPFFTIDKPNFVSDGIPDNAYKVFSLCRNCYFDLQKGTKYIQERLMFNIPRTAGDSKLWFWLVPQLNDPALVQEYVKGADKSLASFKQMLKTSEEMETAQVIDLSDMSEKYEASGGVMNFLTYLVLFHTYDKQKHMRLVGAVDGIYPSRLKELAQTKRMVDAISFKNGQQLKFHFGLLVEFLEDNNNDGWMKTMSYIMSSIFTKKPIDELLIAEIILSKARSFLSRHDLEEWRTIMLNATVILEYLYRVGTLSAKMDSQSGSDIIPSDKKAAAAAEFLNSHQKLLYTKNLRAICATGIAVGVVINAQKRYLRGSDSFISRLNRLEMDYTRLYDLVPQVKMKLKYYKAEEYNELWEYLASNEVSNLDPNQQVQKELMNLIFAVGMAFGLTIGPKKEDKS